MPAVLASSHTPAPGRLHWCQEATVGGPFATSRTLNPSRRSKAAVAINPSCRFEVFWCAMSAQKVCRYADRFGGTRRCAARLNPGLVSAACSRPAPPVGQSPAEHSDRPTAADGRECDRDVPTRPDPRAVASSIAALGGPHWGLTPSFADAACRFRSVALHPLHSAVRKHRRQALTPAARARLVPLRLRARARLCLRGAGPASSPPPMRVCPAWRVARALRLAACPISRASLRRHPVGTPRTAEPRTPATRWPYSPPARPASLPGATSRR